MIKAIYYFFGILIYFVIRFGTIIAHNNKIDEMIINDGWEKLR